MLTCRCPACDHVLHVDPVLTDDTWICCDNCDRGVRPEDAICAGCSARGPFSQTDGIAFRCAGCGAVQPDYAARMTA